MATSFKPDNPTLVTDGSKLFTPDQYHLGVFFRIPHPGSSRRVIAVDKSIETILVSAYTMFITGSIMAVWILIAMAVAYFSSKSRFQNDYLLRSACAWKVTEPFQAAMLMAKYCWVRIRWICCRPRLRRRAGREAISRQSHNEVYSQGLLHTHGGLVQGNTPPQSFGEATNVYNDSSQNIYTESPVSPRKELALGIFVFLLAIGVFAGGIIIGIFLPSKLVVGHVAPVNENKVFLPSRYNNETLRQYEAELSYLVISRITRTVGAVDSSALGQLDGKVQVNKTNPKPGPMGEDSYDIEYKFSVSGVEMGLQWLPDLGFHVEGKCEFEYSWYNGTEISPVDHVMYDKYTLWGNEDRVLRVDLNSTCGFKEEEPTIRIPRDTPVMQTEPPDMMFVLNVYAQGRGSFSQGIDPWYLTGKKLNSEGYGGLPWECGAPGTAGSPVLNKRVQFRVQAGRPMLRCRERSFLSYGDHQPRYQIPFLKGADWDTDPTQAEYEAWLDDLKGSLPQGVTMSPAVASVLGINLARFTPLIHVMVTGKRVLGSRAGDVSYILDAGGASALDDLKRVAMAAYIASRNLFRDAVLEYADPSVAQNVKDDHTIGINALRDPTTGAPIPGCGDWVLPSDNVTTLRFEVLVGIPAIMLFMWFIIFIMRACIWRSHVYGECPACGSIPDIKPQYPPQDIADFRPSNSQDIVLVPVTGPTNDNPDSKSSHGY